MASARFEDIPDGRQPEFELQWADLRYTYHDVQEFLRDYPVSTFLTFTYQLTTVHSGLREMRSTGKTMPQSRHGIRKANRLPRMR